MNRKRVIWRNRRSRKSSIPTESSTGSILESPILPGLMTEHKAISLVSVLLLLKASDLSLSLLFARWHRLIGWLSLVEEKRRAFTLVWTRFTRMLNYVCLKGHINVVVIGQ